MPEFASAYSEKVQTFSPTGSSEEPEFELQLINGIETLVKVGCRNIDDFIQASFEDTKIYNILKKYTNGDESVLTRRCGHFIDATHLPSSLAEAQQALIDVNNQFNRLPGDVKNRFGNSVANYVDFISNGGVKAFNDVFGNKNSSAAQNKNISSSDVGKDVDVSES